jgi:hypothetical protein
VFPTAAFALDAPLKDASGEAFPWQKRNFLPLPQGQGR